MDTATMTPEQMRAEIERLRAANAAHSTIRLKVAEKGGLSVYGLGRFPVTLYKDQWIRLLDMADAIRAFITRHPELKSKAA